MRKLCLLLLATVAAVAADTTGEQFSTQFKNGIDDSPLLRLSGPDADELAKPDGQGLRITLPSTRKNASGNISVSTAFAMRGDCDVTLGYDLLSIEGPISPRTGAGIVLMVEIADNEGKALSVSRMRWPSKDGKTTEDTFGVSLITRKNGKENYDTKRVPATSKSGYLKLERSGENVKISVADGSKDKFHLIREFPVGSADLHSLNAQCRASTGALDVRFVDLTIHAQSFIDEATATSRRGKFGWIPWVVAAVVLAGGIGWFLRRRAKARRPKPPPLTEGDGAVGADDNTDNGEAVKSKADNGETVKSKAVKSKADNNKPERAELRDSSH